MITLGKKGGLPAYRRASAFLLKPKLTPKLFTAFAQRYAERPGGYTRIHKFGNRPGDNAPMAVLELVDNPRDLKFAMTARAVGWEALSKNILAKKTREDGMLEVVNDGVGGLDALVEKERQIPFGQRGMLKGKTRWSLQKVLRFRDEGAVAQFSENAKDYTVRSMNHIQVVTLTRITILIPPQDSVLSRPVSELSRSHDSGSDNASAVTDQLKDLNISDIASPDGRKKDQLWFAGATRKAGVLAPGETGQVLQLAKGALGQPPKWLRRSKLGVDTRPVFG
jgi:large subunit ribosomal protein L17